MTTFQQAANLYIESINNRVTEKTLSPNSARLYKIHANRLAAHFGPLDLSTVKNGIVRDYVSSLKREGLSAATIQAITITLKNVIAAVEDADLEPVYKQQINNKKVGVPKAVRVAQPCAVKEEVEYAIAAGNVLVPFLAITGLRISEALSLEKNGIADSYCPETGIVSIRKTLKTAAAKRDVPLPEAFRLWFNERIPQNGKLFNLNYQRVRDALQAEGLSNPHAFRRFRISHCRKMGMNESVLRRLAGHSAPDITSHYDSSANDSEFVK